MPKVHFKGQQADFYVMVRGQALFCTALLGCCNLGRAVQQHAGVSASLRILACYAICHVVAV